MVQISLFLVRIFIIFGTDFIIFGTLDQLVQISLKFGTDFIIFGTWHKLVQISLFFGTQRKLVRNSLFLVQISLFLVHHSLFLVHELKKFGTDFIIFGTPINYDVLRKYVGCTKYMSDGYDIATKLLFYTIFMFEIFL